MRRLGYEGRLDEIPVERRLVLEDGEYRDLGTPAERAARAAYEAMWADWVLLASVAPDTPETAIPGTELVKLMKDQFGHNKAEARLAAYRQMVDGIGPFPGMLVWRGEDGRGGYWRICECRLESMSCGTCEGACMDRKPCKAGTHRLVTDPTCHGHDYASAQGEQLPDAQPLGIGDDQEVGRRRHTSDSSPQSK